MRPRLKTPRSLLLAPLSLLLACGDSTTTPPDPVAGNYTAILFITTSSGVERDEIQAGSTLVISLNADGTTSGHLHIAASGGGQAFDADMTGTWTRNGFTVSVSQSADTFVRNMPFTIFAQTLDPADGWDLYGNAFFSGTQFRILLRQG